MKLFIIHGWTYNLDRWTKFCELLKAGGIEPIQLRVPGLTESSDAVWDIDGYISWLHSKLEGEPEPIVLGHSNGGRIALAYCQKYPSHFKQLFLVDSAGIPRSAIKNLKTFILKILSKAGKVFSFIPGLKKVFYKFIGGQDYYNAPANMKQTMQNMLAADKDIRPSEIKIPTTIIWGSLDKSTPLSNGQKMHSLINGSSFHVVDDAKHSPFFTHPEEVARVVAQEIKK